jgi:tRNA threonylcarbamoyl adenosine modification protein (Sua5/YciO/YrdC/YwlC family)
LYNKKAVEKIYQIKGFKKRAYLSFICPDLKEIAQYAHVSTPAYKIMRHLTPGPYTFILPASREVPKILLEKKKTVGIRVPDDNVCQHLLADFSHPIISTSARLADQEYTNDIHAIIDNFEPHVDILLDSGPGGLEPSTIIDLSTEEPLLIRKGKGPVQMIPVE